MTTRYFDELPDSQQHLTSVVQHKLDDLDMVSWRRTRQRFVIESTPRQAELELTPPEHVGGNHQDPDDPAPPTTGNGDEESPTPDIEAPGIVGPTGTDPTPPSSTQPSAPSAIPTALRDENTVTLSVILQEQDFRLDSARAWVEHDPTSWFDRIVTLDLRALSDAEWTRLAQAGRDKSSATIEAAAIIGRTDKPMRGRVSVVRVLGTASPIQGTLISAHELWMGYCPVNRRKPDAGHTSPSTTEGKR